MTAGFTLDVARSAGSWSRRAVITAIRGYQLFVSSWLGPACRYQPSCSHYAVEAVARRGVFRGGWLAVLRIGRCHPWGGSGYDPVP